MLLVLQLLNLQVLLVTLMLYNQLFQIFLDKYALEERLMVVIHNVTVILNSVDVVNVNVLVQRAYVVLEVLGIKQIANVIVMRLGEKHQLDTLVPDVQ